jgi:hypothetical protein
LRSIDHLPCLVVPLLKTIAAVGKIEDYGNQYGESPKVVQDIDKGPVAKSPCRPRQAPFNAVKPEKGCAPQLRTMVAPWFLPQASPQFVHWLPSVSRLRNPVDMKRNDRGSSSASMKRNWGSQVTVDDWISCGIADAKAHKIEAGTAAHGTFDQLQSVNVPFNRSVAPGLMKCC